MNDDSGKQTECLVPAEQNGLRLDQVLASAWPERSRAFFQKCIADGLVSVNAVQATTASRRLKGGDQVMLQWPQPPASALQGEKMPLDILLEDDDLVVLNKPAGLVVHPGSGNRTGTLVQGLLFHDQEAFGEMNADELRPGIVHRLDKDTSGALVVAKTPAAEAALKESFKARCTEKTYLAVAIGCFSEPCGSIAGAIARSPRNRLKMAVVSSGGKEALSQYRVLDSGSDCSLLQVRILTGRTHQIRVHLASIRHPVLGDPLYGGRPAGFPFLPSRQLLHAWKLSFPHPATGSPVCCTASLPEDFRQALLELGLRFRDPDGGPLAF